MQTETEVRHVTNSAEPQAAVDGRKSLTTDVSEDEVHEAWRRAGEEYSRRNLEGIDANIAGGPEPTRGS